MRRLVALGTISLATGCSQLLGLEHASNAAPDDAVDPADADQNPVADQLPPADCRTRWLTTPVFGNPLPLGDLATMVDEDLPFLTPDEKTIYFVRNGDLFVSSRASATDPFPAATVESSLHSNDTSVEGKVFVNAALTRAFFSSNRNATNFEFFRGSRNSSSGNFSVDQSFIGSLDDSADQLDLAMTDDLLHAYYVRQPAGGAGTLMFSSRATVNDNFGTPQSLGLTIVGNPHSPTLTADEEVLVYELDLNGSTTFLYATRSGSASSFGTPGLLPGFDTLSSIGSPHLSTDGCRLYFSATEVGNANRDLYVVSML